MGLSFINLINSKRYKKILKITSNDFVSLLVLVCPLTVSTLRRRQNISTFPRTFVASKTAKFSPKKMVEGFNNFESNVWMLGQ